MLCILVSDDLDKAINVMCTPDIEVITGVRSSGKLKFLEMFRKNVSKNIESTTIIHINFNLSEFEELKEHYTLNVS